MLCNRIDGTIGKILILIISFSSILSAQEEGITVQGGNVGVGTTTPTSTLDVNGKLSVRDTILGVNNPVLANSTSSLKVTGDGLDFRSTSTNNLGQLIYNLNDGSMGLSRLEARPGALSGGNTLAWQYGRSPFSEVQNIWVELGDTNSYIKSKVGIGTTVPFFKLDVFDNGPTGRMRINHTTGTNAGLTLATQGTNRFSVAAYQANGAGNIDFGIYNSQTVGPSLIVDGSTNNIGIGIVHPEVRLDIGGGTSGLSAVLLDNARYYGVENTEGSNIRVAGVSVANDVYLGAIDNAGGKVFVREDGITVMTLDNQQLGIGTTNPQRMLHGFSTAAVVARLESSNALGTYLRLHQSGNTESSGAEIRGLTGLATLAVGSDGTGGVINFVNGAAETMRMTNTGNIGIGTISPTQKIHVSDVGANTPSILVEVPGSTFLKASSGATAAALFYKSDRSLVIAPAASTGTVSAVQANSMAVVGASGNVGIGTWSPTQKLDVVGNIKASGTITPSDHRLKKNIQPYHKGLKEVELMQPVTFQYNGKGGTVKDSEHIGLIAQDVQQILPELVQHFTHTDENNEEEKYLEITDSEIQYLLINAIKELNKKIEDQQKIIVSQQTTIDQNQNQVEELKVMLERRKIKEDNPSMEISKK